MYMLRIDEEQREALVRVLASAENNMLQGRNEPLEFWISMLEELPEVEAASPGIIHGFCL